jgi:Ca2+-binding RTX toxin-like protein
MTSIIYHTLNQGKQYRDFRFEVMSDVWGASEQAYLNYTGQATIGTFLDLPYFGGLNSADFQEIVSQIVPNPSRSLINDLWSAVNPSSPYSSNAELRQALDQALASNGVGGHFAFASLAKMQAALDNMNYTADTESGLNFGDAGSLPFSKERAVVYSIAFEAQDVTSILQTMLEDDDRFEAWYDIRYQSNDGSDSIGGGQATALRRYIQSDLFGLYNDATHVGFDEAREVAIDYQAHRDAIQFYEENYPQASSNAKSGNALGSGDIADELQPAILSLEKHFNVTAGHLEEVLYVIPEVTELHGDGTSYDGRGNDDDMLISDSAENILWGDQGNDLLVGNAGNDTLHGGIGNDRLYGGSGNDTMFGESGNDWLFGGPGHNKLDGGGGNDTLIAGDDGDSISGSDGSDKITGGDGADTLSGGSGDDTISGGSGHNKLDGGAGDDTLNAGNDGDSIFGSDGNDKITGGNRADTLNGGNDDDNISGGGGNDTLYGGNGNDHLNGGAGNDRLTGGAGHDVLAGGAGNDTYYLVSEKPDPSPGGESLAGGAGGADQIVETANGGTDKLVLGMAGSYNVKNVETLQLTGNISGNVSLMLNQFTSFDLTNNADKVTITVNHLSKQAIVVDTGGGADTVRIAIAPGVDPSQVLDHKGVTARFDFADLSASDTIDLRPIGIKAIVTNSLTVSSDTGYYLMAPDTKIHVVEHGHEVTTYTNDTHSWFVTKLGDHTPYGPEFFGHVTAGNFDI